MSNFLWLEGIEGESGNPWHSGEIDILFVDFGFSKQFNKPGKISRSGKVIHDISVTKKSNEDTSKLIDAMIIGKTFTNGLITLESKNTVTFIEMANVSIQAFSSSTSVETVSLAYDTP